MRCGVSALCDNKRYKIQEALFNVGLHENLITFAHLSYFPTNKCTRFVTYPSTFSHELATGNGTTHKHTRKQGTPNISRSPGNLNLRTHTILTTTAATFERVVNTILSQLVRKRLASRNVGHTDVELGRCKIVSKVHVLTDNVSVSINRRHSTAPAGPCKRSRDTRHAWLPIRCRCFLSVSKSTHPSARAV